MPGEPAQGSLGAQDGEGQGEGSPTRIVHPCRVDHEPDRERNRSQNDRQGYAGDQPSGRGSEVSGGFGLHGAVQSLLAAFSELFFSEAPFSEGADSPLAEGRAEELL